MRKPFALLGVLIVTAACSESPTSVPDSISVDPVDATAIPDRRLPAPVVVDFQTPAVAGCAGIYDVFEDPNT